MKRFINQINVSITTNRTCTLRCDHCYIAPFLFDDKSQMTTETFRSIFDQVDRLYDLDSRLEVVEWEAIGGETTMMPFEWWEKNLPWALERISAINAKVGHHGSLNFLTNLVYSDKRYTDLINQYANHPAFCLYTSWEPDTGRFGKNNKLFPKFLKTLESIHAEQKIMDVILTREVVKLGPDYLIDTFATRGVTDFSIKMLSPYGSGKKFFEDNMIDFNSMSDYLIRLGKIKPSHVTFTPEEEMLGSLHGGSSFQCNGNFLYDLAIEPDGNCTFNANQTADEASLGSRIIHISDPLWSNKVMYENKKEENNKLSLAHPICGECEYMRYCNSGWYHYKIHDPKIIRLFDENECSGYKKMWDVQKERIGDYGFSIENDLHQRAIERVIDNRMFPQELVGAHNLVKISESSLPKAYDDYFKKCETIDNKNVVLMDMTRRYSKTVDERIWFYESHKINTVIENPEFINESIVRHWFYRNYKYLHLSNEIIQGWLLNNPSSELGRRIGAIKSFIEGSTSVASGTSVDSRHEELIRTMLDRQFCQYTGMVFGDKIEESLYINMLSIRRNIERSHDSLPSSP